MEFKKREFTLTKEHIKLLRNAYVEWDDCATGAPGINPKRPYGSSMVATDIYKILEGRPPDDSFYEDKDLQSSYLQYHWELGTALQIVLTTGKFEPGNYETDCYDRNWKKVEL